jgi:hypothetical protein
MQGFKFNKTQGKYKASNNEFNVVLKQATSYGWWIYVKHIDGLVVFNSYPYSNTTRAHQRKMRRLLDYLGIRIDVEVNVSDSLAKAHGIGDIELALSYQAREIQAALDSLKRKGTIKHQHLLRQLEKVNQHLDTVRNYSKVG